MRKLLSLTLAILLIAGSAYAINSPAAPNVRYIDGHREPTQYPSVEVRLVRYGHMGDDVQVAPSLSSGDPVRWDLNSADGITITACVASFDAAFAGILVTDIATADNDSVDTSDDNWGWIAVRGYCLASVAPGQTQGRVMHTSAVIAASPSMQNSTVGQTTTDATGVSLDTGIMLLETTTTNERLAPVMMY